jgi:uncharacterized protein
VLKLKEQQALFVDAIRNPGKALPPPGVQAHEMRVYRELFFSNIESFLASGFPILKKVMASSWTGLVDDFFSCHRAETPFFVEIGSEFVRYLSEERGQQSGDPLFLAELAHYEWVELHLFVHEGVLRANDGSTPELSPHSEVRLSEVALPLAYRYPVHQIDEDTDFKLSESPTFFLAYRDVHESVTFKELNWATYRLIELLRMHPGSTIEELLSVLASEASLDLSIMRPFGLELFLKLLQEGAIERDDP